MKWQNANINYLYLLVVFLFFIDCNTTNNTIEEPKFIHNSSNESIEKNTQTTISLPFTLNVKEFEKFFERELPIGKVLFEGTDIAVSNFAKADIKVRNVDKIEVYTVNNKIAVKLKAKINIAARATKLFKNLNKKDVINASAIGYLTPAFDENWNFTPDIELKLIDYEAIEIKIAGIKIKLDDFVLNELEHQLNKSVKPALLSLVKRKVDIRKDVLKLWNSLDPVYNIAAKPANANLVIQKPINFSLAPILCEENLLKLKINVSASVKSVIGRVSVANSLGALPKLQTDSNLNDAFSIYLPSSVSFSEINSFLNSKLKSYTVNTEGRNVKLQNFKVGGLNDKQIWIKTDFESDGINGSFYLYASPKINNRTNEVSLVDIKYQVESESWLLASASYLYNDKIIASLQKNLKYNFSKDLNKLIQQINQQYLNNYEILGMQVNGRLNELQVKDYEISENYISFFPLANGKLSVDVNELSL